MSKEPVTVNGLKKLSEELIFLKEKKRPEIVNSISEARSHGDLKENAEYHAAKEQQSLNEGRIQEIEDVIARANVIDVTKLENDEVTVELEDGTEWTGDVNSVINTGTLEDEKQEDDFIPMSGFDAAINQQFSDLIDDV